MSASTINTNQYVLEDQDRTNRARLIHHREIVRVGQVQYRIEPGRARADKGSARWGSDWQSGTEPDTVESNQSISGKGRSQVNEG